MNEQNERNKSIEEDISDREIEIMLNDADEKVAYDFETEHQPQREPEEPKRKFYSFFHSFVLPVLYGILIALILTQVLFFHAQVPSGSMETTILTGDRILGNRMAYWFQTPDYGDIIIFWSEEYNEFMVKRVIGCPGDRVEIRFDGVYVNNNRIADDYTQGETIELNIGEDVWDVPENSYFVMGDNRENSADSRYWNSTFVPQEEIYARYMFRYSFGKNGWYLDWNDKIDFWAEP